MLRAVQEFDITGIPQRITQGDVVNMQTTWWDEQEEGVLLFETKLLGRWELRKGDLGAKEQRTGPGADSTSKAGHDCHDIIFRASFIGGEELILEVSSARGPKAVWTFQR